MLLAILVAAILLILGVAAVAAYVAAWMLMGAAFLLLLGVGIAFRLIEDGFDSGNYSGMWIALAVIVALCFLGGRAVERQRREQQRRAREAALLEARMEAERRKRLEQVGPVERWFRGLF